MKDEKNECEKKKHGRKRIPIMIKNDDLDSGKLEAVRKLQKSTILVKNSDTATKDVKKPSIPAEFVPSENYDLNPRIATLVKYCCGVNNSNRWHVLFSGFDSKDEHCKNIRVQHQLGAFEELMIEVPAPDGKKYTVGYGDLVGDYICKALRIYFKEMGLDAVSCPLFCVASSCNGKVRVDVNDQTNKVQTWYYRESNEKARERKNSHSALTGSENERERNITINKTEEDLVKKIILMTIEDDEVKEKKLFSFKEKKAD